MKKHAILVVSGILYLTSLFVPAYRGLPGHMCLMGCAGRLIPFNQSDFGFGLYYPAFLLTNLVFLFALYRGLRERAKTSLAFICIAAFGFLHLASWFIINMLSSAPPLTDLLAAEGVVFVPSSQMTAIDQIDIGYYLWATAYFLVLYSLIQKRKNGA
jgi:hypothetical protein